MPSNFTENYQLNQWEPGDKVQRADFNADNAKIDAALKAEADTRTAETTALTAAVAKRGNCQIAFTSYMGQGDYGPEHPNVLTFPAAPSLVFIFSSNGGIGIMRGGGTHIRVLSGSVVGGTATWSEDGKTVSWYASHQNYQMCESHVIYQVLYFYVA